MKKTLLLFAAALFSLMASAGDGLVAVGANVILLPSSYYDNDIEWSAWTWVYNSQAEYGEWNDTNPNYNVICGIDPLTEEYGPRPDAEGRQWYEPGFDLDWKEGDVNLDVWDAETGEDTPIYWEEHTAPFSSDATWGGKPSYQWTGNSIMADIYVRRTFTTDQLLSGPVFLACGHDDAPCEYYINGELVFQRTGFEGEYTDNQGNIHYAQGWNNAEYIQLTDEQKELIKLNGEENLVAFHVHQNWGGAFADCGLYTKIEGGLDMGYTTPWEGKVLFNNRGGYLHAVNNQPVEDPKHPWSKLYEAQEGDEYTFLIPGSCSEEMLEDATIYDDYTDDEGYPDVAWKEMIQFKTPIKIKEDHGYTFKARVLADKPIEHLVVKLGDNNADYKTDSLELAYDYFDVPAPAEGQTDYNGKLIELEFNALEDVDNFMIAFDFIGGQDSTTVTIKDMSLIGEDYDDEGEDKELWIGTHYFNFFNMTKANKLYEIWDDDLNDGDGGTREATQEEIDEGTFDDLTITCEVVDAPEVTGRVETMAWTLPDFDDSMWDDQMMPVGSADYTYRASAWPGGNNTNYWIRRNFELDKINERVEYQLNVCHDDTYWTYVNGHLLQQNGGWTDGKNPVQVHIPARYLNVGKNVIATYIQQNWGGRFYDCGINVTEVNYDDCLKQFNDALAYAQKDTLLTNKMKADVQAIVARAQQFYQENRNDAAELRSYARDSIRVNINRIFAYSNDVKTLKDTYDICRKEKDNGYWGTALTDAVAALDTCATNSQLTPYLTNLRNGRKANAMERHNEKFVGTSRLEIATMDDLGNFDGIAPTYYIYNVGAKNFLGGGEDWGTHQVVEYASNAMMLVQAMQDVVDEETGDIIDEEPIEGAVFIETFRPNGDVGIADFLGWNGYVDKDMGNNRWELIPVEGKPNVFNIAQYGQTFDAAGKTFNGTEFEAGGKKLLGLRSGDNGFAPSYYLVDTDCHSPELETNQWMFISREELLGFIATASNDNPVDLTFLIENPGYDQRLSIDSWIFSADGGNNGVWGRNGNHHNFVLESYDSKEFSNYQELWPEEAEEALPAGNYLLTVQGYYRDGIEQKHVEKVLNHEPISQRAFIFAGPEYYDNNPDMCETMPLMPIHIEANKVPGIGYTFGGMRMPGTYNGQPMSACEQAANEYFQYGLYQNQLLFTIPEDDPGYTTFGIVKVFDEERLGGDWIVMDNWRLKYLGNGEIDPDGIKGIESDEIKKTNTASRGIYNMLGQRLQKIQKGVNIVGGKKIIKK